MNAQTWIDIAGLVIGGGGGGTAVAKLTRLVIAVEQLAEEIKADRAKAEKMGEKIQDHEIRLARRGM